MSDLAGMASPRSVSAGSVSARSALAAEGTAGFESAGPVMTTHTGTKLTESQLNRIAIHGRELPSASDPSNRLTHPARGRMPSGSACDQKIQLDRWAEIRLRPTNYYSSGRQKPLYQLVRAPRSQVSRSSMASRPDGPGFTILPSPKLDADIFHTRLLLVIALLLVILAVKKPLGGIFQALLNSAGTTYQKKKRSRLNIKLESAICLMKTDHQQIWH